MFPIIQVGPIALQTPGLLLLISLWIGITLAEKSANLHRLSAENLSNLILVALLSGIVGARIVYAAQYPTAFAANPLNLLSLSPKLLDLNGGLAAAAIGGMVFAQRKKMPLRQTLDALVPFFGMLAIGLSLANLASGNAFGAETNLPWKIKLWGANRHPSQIYSMLAALVTLNLLYPPKQNPNSPAGRSFLIFTAATASYTLFLEAFRGDSTLIFNGIRSTQVLAWLVLALSFYLLDKLEKHPKSE
jgi:prolipoprotein diacylglyceryltransferase